jgi:hypothetical protein
MSRSAFLTSPGAWLHTRRQAQTQADYACAVQQVKPRRWPRIVACLARCIVIGFCLSRSI